MFCDIGSDGMDSSTWALRARLRVHARIRAVTYSPLHHAHYPTLPLEDTEFACGPAAAEGRAYY